MSATSPPGGPEEELEEGLRLVVAPNPSPFTGAGTNTYLLGRGEVAVVDPGPDLPQHLAAVLAALEPGERVALILVTHAHADHSALAPGLARATGAPVQALGPAGAGRSALMQRLAAAGLAGGGEGVDAGFRPDREVKEGDLLEGSWGVLQVLHTPGHFPGHLAIAWGSRLFVGDTVMAWATSVVSPPDGDMAAYMASLQRLATGEWSRMYPGHGAPVEDPAARVAALLAHRQGREAAILAALAAGPARVEALVQRVYADVPPPLHAAAARSLLAHLIALWEQGIVTADPSLSASATFALA